MPNKLSDEDITRFAQWIIENVDDTLVPNDEGNGDALVYNIVQRLRFGKERASRYTYLPEQDAEIASWDRPEV